MMEAWHGRIWGLGNAWYVEEWTFQQWSGYGWDGSSYERGPIHVGGEVLIPRSGQFPELALVASRASSGRFQS